ncbi:MAG TPA: class I SAM-dependent methyltransferase [Chloroflexi bacterium]|nr:class I SAM-dependent methyltransferase [Chloroflexota bacterium]
MALPAAPTHDTLTRMSTADRIRWNARYLTGDAPIATQPNHWLASQVDALDHVAAVRLAQGEAPTALDVACGAGGTVIWLAQRGWLTTGVDISDAALSLARRAAAQQGVAERTTFLVVDLDEWRPAPAAFDCVTCFYFLNRALWPWLQAAVRPGGLLALQTHHHGVLKVRPTANPEYLLAPGELKALIASWGWTLLATSDPAAATTSEAVLAQRPLV